MIRNTVADALQYLAGIDDHGRTRDGVGFSRYDVEFGHSIAEALRHGHVSPGRFRAAQKLCHKYRKQLVRAGFDPDVIAQEAFEGAQPVTPVVFTATMLELTDRAVKLMFRSRKDVCETGFIPRTQVLFLRMVGKDGLVEVAVPASTADDLGIAPEKST